MGLYEAGGLEKFKELFASYDASLFVVWIATNEKHVDPTGRISGEIPSFDGVTSMEDFRGEAELKFNARPMRALVVNKDGTLAYKGKERGFTFFSIREVEEALASIKSRQQQQLSSL